MAEVGYIFPEDAAKQVVEVGNAIKATDDKLLKYTEDASKLITLLKQQNISFEQLQKVQKETVETTTKLDAIGKTLLDSETKLKQVTDKRTESIIRNRAETRNATRDIQLKVRAQQAERGSIEQLSAVNAILEKRLKSVNLATVEGAKKAEILRNAINRNTTKIMANSSEFSKWKINIGNYRSALESLPGPIGNVVSQTGNIVTAVAKLGPVGGIVAGTIVAAGAGLLAFFTATERGAEMMERKWAGMKAAWKTLVGEIAKGGQTTMEAFEEPKQGKFWTTIFAFNPSKRIRDIGKSMDAAAYSAELYTKTLQDVEDEEKRLIVPRELATGALKKAYEIYNDTETSLDERRKSLKNIIKIEDEAAAKEIQLQQVKVAALREVKAARDADGLDATEARNKLYEAEGELARLDYESSSRKRRTVKMITSLDKEEIASKEKVNEAAKKAADEEKKYYKDLDDAIFKANLAIETEFDKEISTSQERYDALIKQREDYDTQMRILSQQLFDDADKAEEEKNNAKMEAADKEGKEQKEKDNEDRTAKQQRNQEIIQQAGELGDTLFGLKLANLNREFLAAEGDAKKQSKIAEKMAKTERNQALFGIAIRTALGIMSALTSIPPNIPLSIGIGVIGGVQAATVAARPIPKFATGTDYAPNEFIAGEAGRELVKTKSGEVILADKATYFKGFKGATVKTNRETERIISESGKGNNFVFDTTELRDEMRAVKKAIVKKPVMITDNSGRVIGKEMNNYRETYLNRMRNGR